MGRWRTRGDAIGERGGRCSRYRTNVLKFPGPPLPAMPSPDDMSEETIFSVLAARAQSQSRVHLAMTAVIGLVDAVALGWAHPALWSIAAVLAAGGAYGAWGLIDRVLAGRVAAGALDTPGTNALRILREVTALTGLLALLAAFGGIWDASLGGWRH